MGAAKKGIGKIHHNTGVVKYDSYNSGMKNGRLNRDSPALLIKIYNS